MYFHASVKHFELLCGATQVNLPRLCSWKCIDVLFCKEMLSGGNV